MHSPNFCVECGERMARRGWRGWLNPHFCKDCARRLGRSGRLKAIVIISIIAGSAFAIGRYSRPPAPPLLIQRSPNSPLSDLPVNPNDVVRTLNRKESSATGPVAALSSVDEPGYICGARTKKGTPCHRRVHAVGERCFQHKGLPAMVALEKLVVKSK